MNKNTFLVLLLIIFSPLIRAESSNELLEKSWKLVSESTHDPKTFDKALSMINKSISLNKDHANSYRARSQIWVYKNNYDNAIKDINHAIKLAPEFGPFYAKRAAIKSYMGDHESANLDFKMAVELDPYDLTVNNDYGYFQEMVLESFANALVSYNSALKTSPNDINALNNRGRLLYKLKQFDLSLLDFNKIIRLKPENAGPAWYYRGKIYEQQNDLVKAREMYQNAINIANEFPWVEGYPEAEQSLKNIQKKLNN